MPTLLYIRLIGYTAGTLLMLFWMVVILGYRRQRNFERVFFFLCLALFFFYSGSLLALNAQVHYSSPPPVLEAFSQTLVVIALWILPALLLHLNIEYAIARASLATKIAKIIWIAAAYIPAPCLMILAYLSQPETRPFNFLIPVSSFSAGYRIWLFLVLVVSALWQRRFQRMASQKTEKDFHLGAALALGIAAFLVLDLHVRSIIPGLSETGTRNLSAFLTFLPLFPLTELIYRVHKHNFLQIGRQRNLVYAVSITFLALLYLSLTRRVGEWLEPVFPPEATAAVLVFVLVILFEPLQRSLSRILKTTAQDEFDRSNRIIGAIREVARLGSMDRLRRFIEKWIEEQFELAEAKLALSAGDEAVSPAIPQDAPNDFEVRHAGRLLGTLRVKPHGAMLSGETRAALEFLCEQLPAALDLCRLIEEKLRLERELAERERMAALGQMAASVSHNLKNPLGSIKTILQVQLESPELPESLRGETRLMLDEISRLSAKLNQLLQFSRPAVIGEGNVASDAAEIAREVVGVLRHEADQRGITLEVNPSTEAIPVSAPAEALRDIVSNLVVNALDATSRGGRVAIAVSTSDARCAITVTDSGPGIPPDLRDKVLQPFFTTKAHGTGLGLAIVARRIAEAGGTLDFQSPVQDGQGTRFLVALPLSQALAPAPDKRAEAPKTRKEDPLNA